MSDIALRFNHDMVVVDGAMGTVLLQEGISGDECPLLLNVLDPELIVQIHERYIMAGAQAITTNSFGGSRAKLSEYHLEDRLIELNRAAVQAAKAANPQHVLASVGPCGLLLEPLGSATFEQVFAQYAEQIAALALEEPDAILIETITDIADARCALLAAKSVCNLPVFVSCSFDASGHMPLSGTSPEAAAVILTALGASVIGLNCSLGPKQLLPLARRMRQASTLPLIVQANAGLPRLDRRGQTVYSGTADDFSAAAYELRELGVQFVGSCCGSTPTYTGAIYATVGGLPVVPQLAPPQSGQIMVASPQKTLALGSGQPVRIIGERINPTGKPQLTAELEKGSLSLVRTLAASQEAAGATLLDVNVGAPLVDAREALPAAVRALQGFVAGPLVFDTTDYEALELALRIYPGRAVINSVNGDEEHCRRVFPLAKTYGATVIALCMDADGIPDTVEGRLRIAERIRVLAHNYGLSDQDLIFDVLTMTAASDSTAPFITLEGVRLLSEQGLVTVLGVSNVSHGLPDRPALNAAFVTAAIAAGLSAAIANPNDPIMRESVSIANTQTNRFELPDALETWSLVFKQVMAKAENATLLQVSVAGNASSLADTSSPEILLKQAVLRGDREATPDLVDAVIASGVPATVIVETFLTPTLKELGEAFARGEAFLPQMMLAAGSMKAAVEHIKKLLPQSALTQKARRVLFCTVEGDVHSIGKDICVALLESQGFEVFDLGVDVSAQEIIACAKEKQVEVICLSALMTTTLQNMQATVEQIYAELPEFRGGQNRAVAVGGAVVSEPWAKQIGVYYASDAPACVELIHSIIKQE